MMIFIGLVLAAVLGVILYWFSFSEPTSFPTNEELVKDINELFPQANASVIQDTIPIGEHNVLVPFISSKDDYGLSYWVWEKHKWRIANIDTKAVPMIWQVDRNDPSSYHFVWNIHPKDALSSMDFYLIRDRGYFITEGIERYYPRLQLKKQVSINEESYGVLQLPDDWISIMNAFKKMESEQQADWFNDNFFYGQYMVFGWIPYDRDGKESFPENSANGQGFSNGDVGLEHVMTLSKEELETWDEKSGTN
jgi:hypothetical protein